MGSGLTSGDVPFLYTDGDKIQILNLGAEFDTYAEIMAVAEQTADGVLLDFGNDRSLLVEDVNLSDLTSDYFLF